MLMTVVMKDAEDSLPPELAGRLEQLVYADDTLLVARTVPDMQKWLHAVQTAAAGVGLEMHWGKLQLLRVRCRGNIRTPGGDIVQAPDTLMYLGTSISNDGRVGGELARRLGIAFAEFRGLQKLWGHTSISRQRKIELFNAIVVPKLLYSMSAACLSKAEKRRLDGAHGKMLRGQFVASNIR